MIMPSSGAGCSPLWSCAFVQPPQPARGRVEPLESQLSTPAVKAFARHQGHDDRLGPYVDEFWNRKILMSQGAQSQHLDL
jgi:hypothetical protein